MLPFIHAVWNTIALAMPFFKVAATDLNDREAAILLNLWKQTIKKFLVSLGPVIAVQLQGLYLQKESCISKCGELQGPMEVDGKTQCAVTFLLEPG